MKLTFVAGKEFRNILNQNKKECDVDIQNHEYILDDDTTVITNGTVVVNGEAFARIVDETGRHTGVTIEVENNLKII